MQDRYLKVIAAGLAYQAVNTEYERLLKHANASLDTTRAQRQALYDKKADLLAILTETEL